MTMTWISDLMHSAFADPAGRIVDVSCDETEVAGVALGRVMVTFTVEDFRGGTYEAKGRILVPRQVEGRLATVYHCGYEAPEEIGAKEVARGRVSVTPVQLPLEAVYPNSWSILRGPKMEFVLGHLVRSLPFVDPARVVYAGGSAGGYSALMAAAEAFPAAAAVPVVPPTNLAYMGAKWATNYARLAGTGAASLPWLEGLRPAVQAWYDVFGEDLDAPGWLGHSPVAHVDRVTCPVAAFFSMADGLVPIDQVDQALAKPIVTAQPGNLELRAEALTDAAAAHVRLLDVLGDRADVHMMTIPDEYGPMTDADLTMLTERPPLALPDVQPVAGRWALAVADEGEPVWVVSHYKHSYEPDMEGFVQRALAEEKVSVEQLTAPKLAQLLDRYAGRQWLAPGFAQLDRPEAERADVELGLRRYCGESAEHAARFAALYDEVEPSNRVLPEQLVGEFRRS